MHAQRIVLGCALLMTTGCQTIGGEGMPTLTRSGEVKDVIIRENVDPASLTVNAGDEIRWINKRQAVVRVIFLHPMTENLACQRNFGGMLGFGTKRNQYSAKLRPNKTASVCFRESGEVKYVVRAESADYSGEQNLAGTISIGPEYQVRRPPSSDMSSQLAAARTDRQRMADELAAAQGQLADRDATLTSIRSQLDQSVAAQAGKDQALLAITTQLADEQTNRQRMADELAAAQGQLANRDASLDSLRSELRQSIAARFDGERTASDMSARLAAAESDRQRMAEELTAAQAQLADRDASLASLRSQLGQSIAARFDKEQAASDVNSRLAAAEKDRQRLADELAVAQRQVADRDARLTSLRSQLDHKIKLANAETDLLKALQPEISKGTVVVQQSDDALTINLASTLLFESGQDQMKVGATDALKRVGTVLKGFPDKQVHVAGYTDNVAIRGTLHKKFPSNKELSDARANRAAQALRDGGVSANLWSDGYADSNPVAPNTTATGRAKNRRVEIIVAAKAED